MLDGLRGVAALVVVFGHLFSALPLDLGFRLALFTGPLGFLFNGAAAVHVFFILSGFVLTHSLMRAGGFSVASVPGFLVRRIMRLQPPYLAAVGFAWLASSYYTVPHPLGAGPFIAAHSLVSASFTNLLPLVWMFPNRAYGLIPVAWTLRVEMIYSLLMPALVAGLATHVLLFAGLVIGLLSLPLHLVWPFYICNFAVGILMRRHYGYLSNTMAQRG
jgi:peptidoglycan/LPS O-acetylase OafA/YrhL